MPYRFFLCTALLLLFAAACGNGSQSENGPDIPLPPVIISDYAQGYNDILIAPQEEFIPELDIPSFNEYTVFLDFEPETRIIRGIESVRYTNRTDTNLNKLVFRVPLNAWSGNEFLSPSPPPYPADLYSRIFRQGHDYGFMDILHVSQDNEELDHTLRGTILDIELSRTLAPDETTQIHIQFEALIPMIAHRTGANEKAIWAGTFLPVEAVFGPSGWHRPPYYPTGNPFILDIANYTVEIITPLGYTVAGTGVKTETYLDEHKITSFTAQMTRDFAFAISPHFNRASTMTNSGAVEIGENKAKTNESLTDTDERWKGFCAAFSGLLKSMLSLCQVEWSDSINIICRDQASLQYIKDHEEQIKAELVKYFKLPKESAIVFTASSGYNDTESFKENIQQQIGIPVEFQ